MRILKLTFYKLFILGLIGPFLVLFTKTDPAYRTYLLPDFSLEFVQNVFIIHMGSVGLLFLLLYFVVNKQLAHYYKKVLAIEPKLFYERVWRVSFFLSVTCIFIMVYQTHFKFPLFQFILNPSNYAEQRFMLREVISAPLFNIGLHLFIALNIFCTFGFLESKRKKIASLLVLVLFISFNLAKSPIIDISIQLLFTFSLLKPISKKGLSILFMCLCLIFVVMWLTHINDGFLFGALLQGFNCRLFLGEFKSLPYYFYLFEKWTPPFVSILPPYVTQLFGYTNLIPPSKIVIQHLFPNGLFSGFANSFFIGDAYAYMGRFSVVLAPIVITCNYYIISTILSKFRKTLLNTFIFGYFMYKLSNGLSSSIGVYFLSSIQLMFILFILVKCEQHYQRRNFLKNIQ